MQSLTRGCASGSAASACSTSAPAAAARCLLPAAARHRCPPPPRAAGSGTPQHPEENERPGGDSGLQDSLIKQLQFEIGKKRVRVRRRRDVAGHPGRSLLRAALLLLQGSAAGSVPFSDAPMLRLLLALKQVDEFVAEEAEGLKAKAEEAKEELEKLADLQNLKAEVAFNSALAGGWVGGWGARRRSTTRLHPPQGRPAKSTGRFGAAPAGGCSPQHQLTTSTGRQSLRQSLTASAHVPTPTWTRGFSNSTAATNRRRLPPPPPPPYAAADINREADEFEEQLRRSREQQKVRRSWEAPRRPGTVGATNRGAVELRRPGWTGRPPSLPAPAPPAPAVHASLSPPRQRKRSWSSGRTTWRWHAPRASSLSRSTSQRARRGAAAPPLAPTWRLQRRCRWVEHCGRGQYVGSRGQPRRWWVRRRGGDRGGGAGGWSGVWGSSGHWGVGRGSQGQTRRTVRPCRWVGETRGGRGQESGRQCRWRGWRGGGRGRSHCMADRARCDCSLPNLARLPCPPRLPSACRRAGSASRSLPAPS